MENEENNGGGADTSGLSIEEQLDGIVELEPDALSEEQRTMLTENKDKLTPQEIERFGIEVDEGGEGKGGADGKGGTGEGSGAGDGGATKTVDAEATEVRLREAFGVDDSGLEEAEKKIFDRLSAPLKAQAAIVLNQEIDRVVSANPLFQPYKALIKKYAEHPKYANVDIEIIAKGLAFDDALENSKKSGAQAEREANARNQRRSAPGRGQRPMDVNVIDGIPDVDQMTPKQFEEHVNKVKAGEFRKR